MSVLHLSSLLHGTLLLRGGPPAAHDVPLHVVAGTVAADVRPAELDRPVVGGRGDAFDEEGRDPAALGEQTGLARFQQHGLETLTSPGDARPIALVEHGVERLLL